jgi:hypothetical protein
VSTRRRIVLALAGGSAAGTVLGVGAIVAFLLFGGELLERSLDPI